MVELMQVGANKPLPEGVRADNIKRLTDTNVDDGIYFEITVSGLLPMSDRPTEVTTQPWRVILSPDLARENR